MRRFGRRVTSWVSHVTKWHFHRACTVCCSPHSPENVSVEGPRSATILEVELVLVSVVGASARATDSPTRLFVRIKGGGHPGWIKSEPQFPRKIPKRKPRTQTHTLCPGRASFLGN